MSWIEVATNVAIAIEMVAALIVVWLNKREVDYLEDRVGPLIVDVEDQSYESAAEVLGVPIGTVRSRLFRGRRLMQEHLLSVATDAGLRGTTAA